MADAAKPLWLDEEGEIRNVGRDHSGDLSLVIGIGIVVETFGEQ
jgi:hypothetical protein